MCSVKCAGNHGRISVQVNLFFFNDMKRNINNVGKIVKWNSLIVNIELNGLPICHSQFNFKNHVVNKSHLVRRLEINLWRIFFVPCNYVEIYALKLGSCIKPVCIIEIEMLKIVDRDMHDFFCYDQ